MSDSEEEINKPLKKKKSDGSLFRRQRAFCRKRAMQFIYRLDVCQDWTIRPEALEVFKGMLDDLEDDSEGLDRKARAGAYPYMEDIIRGVREHLNEIDELIRSAAKNWRLERMGPVERCLLRVAVFEMAYVKKVSAATAINEAIELSKSFGQGDTPRFVNGVLERVRQLLEDPRQRAAAAKMVAEAEAERLRRLQPAEPEEPAEEAEVATEEASEQAEAADVSADDELLDTAEGTAAEEEPVVEEPSAEEPAEKAADAEEPEATGSTEA